ncbi:MAG TPA: YidC/Oxa1 family membrane protein insertase [Solirubrobacteraceae bacterium]|nr:YidC/Oxa1 family membrane protein insertase [Solirubrobacteraceae bacterium]
MLVVANIFQPLITVFEAVLKFFHNHVGVGWGLSIVLLTILIRVILLPLTLKQFHSMQSLQRLQPELKAIQNKYKDDKQRQQQELMKFYKENNVNPLASCLPLVAQLPVFISLFYMLRKDLRDNICPVVQAHFRVQYAAAHHMTLKAVAGQTTPCGPHAPGAGFLFIPDLTNKATGGVLVALILLYVGTQLASTVMMQSPTMDATQRRLMMLLPLFFVLFIISFPAGVIVYWVTTNSWTILQQFIVKRRLGPMGPPVPATAGGDAAGKVSAGRAPAARAVAAETDADTNGAGSSGGGALSGLGGLLRGKPKEEATVATKPRGGPPPRPPRKKKKRSGRRR